MSCELYDDVLDEYVDGARAADHADRADARLAAFESHLAGCARCQGLVADFATIRRTAAALDEHLPPPRVWAKIASSIEQEERQPWWARSLANTPAVRVPLAAAALLARAITALGRPAGVDVAIAPSFPALDRVREALSGSGIALAAQDVYHEREGAFTGEVSAAMLKDAGVTLVLVGHSERRLLRGERETDFARKMTRLVRGGSA